MSSWRRPAASWRVRPSRRRSTLSAEARAPALREQIGVLAARSARKIFRQPALLVFPMVFPLLLFAVNASGLGSATELPGFPADSYESFALAVPFMQGALFVAINAGTELARDIETGFLSRLSLTPMRRVSLLAGQLGGAIAVGVIQSLLYLAVGLVAGVGIASGPGG